MASTLAVGAISASCAQSNSTTSAAFCLEIWPSPANAHALSKSARCFLPSVSSPGFSSSGRSGRRQRLFRLPVDLGRRLGCSKDRLPINGFLSENDDHPSTAMGSSSPLLPLLTQINIILMPKGLRPEVLQVMAKTNHKGRVGTYKREGNVSLASFGTKLLKSKKGIKIDIMKTLSKMLPFVVAATAVAALTKPASFSWVRKEYYAPALGGIMLSIGVQLSVADFALAVRRPLPVLIGYLAQYMVKPLLGVIIVMLFNVPAAFAPGLVLTSCVAGAQLSSYAAFLSEGDVALSIVLTSLTTISSVAVTPLLTRVLIGSVVPVDVVAMASSILQVVIGPVFLGLTLNTYAKPLVDKVRSFMPLMAMMCTSLCIGSPLALNRARIMSTQGLQLMLPVLSFHLGAFILGYWICRVPLWRQGEKEARTIALCTGMQSSTLAMLLASQFLGGSNAVPPACSVVVMALMGLSLASFWGKGNQIRDLVPVIVTENNRGLGLISN